MPFHQSPFCGKSRSSPGDCVLQAGIRTASLRDTHEDRWEGEDHDEEEGLEDSTALGRRGLADEDPGLPSRGFEKGAKGFKLLGLDDPVGRNVETAWWNWNNEPRWHPGFIIEREGGGERLQHRQGAGLLAVGPAGPLV